VRGSLTSEGSTASPACLSRSTKDVTATLLAAREQPRCSAWCRQHVAMARGRVMRDESLSRQTRPLPGTATLLSRKLTSRATACCETAREQPAPAASSTRACFCNAAMRTLAAAVSPPVAG